MDFRYEVIKLTEALVGAIAAGVTFRVIITLMQCRNNDTSIKEGLRKCKRVIKAGIIAVCLSAFVSVIERYFK